MKSLRIEEQLNRIDEILKEIRRVILDESLDNFEELIAEMGSRINTLVYSDGELITGLGEYRSRFEALLISHREVSKLTRDQLKHMALKLRCAHQKTQLNRKYTSEPAKIAASLKKSTDLMG